MQRKKSGFFSHSANILLQPKNPKRTTSSSAKSKAQLPAIFQMYQYKALSLKLFFLYIAGGVQTLKCMCSKIPSSEKKKRAIYLII